MPIHVRTTVDLTKYYIKSPNEMTRAELAELEKELREIEEEAEEEAKNQQKPEGEEEQEEAEEDKEDELTRGKKKRMIRKAQKEQNA